MAAAHLLALSVGKWRPKRLVNSRKSTSSWRTKPPAAGDPAAKEVEHRAQRARGGDWIALPGGRYDLGGVERLRAKVSSAGPRAGRLC